MFFDIKIGVDKEGNIKVIDMKVLNNIGVYGDNGFLVCFELGYNVFLIYNNVFVIKFDGRIVYINLVLGGVLRGYGVI